MAETSIDDEQLRGLLQVLAHDLRNPLAAVVTNLEFARRVLAETRGDPDVAESLVDSQSACAVLQQLIGNLEVLAASSQRSSPHDVALLPACREVVERCGARARQAGLELELDGAVAASAHVDRALFMLALENLICNGIQHAPRGTHVMVKLYRGEEGVRLDICDSGGAIPSDARAQAMSAEGQTKEGRHRSGRYSRGAGLLVAQLAAERTGMQLVIAGDGVESTLTLLIPTATVK